MIAIDECNVFEAGLLDYLEALELQKNVLNDVIAGRSPHALISCQHNHVITLGRRANRDNILVSQNELQELGVEVHYADRGGEVTYHGPGQVVLYPIFDLRRDKKDLNSYLRKLEEVVIRSLRDNFGLNAHRKAGFTGVWVGPYKVASIGIGVKHWVAYHGLALNVGTDKSYFSLIKSCGLDAEMASINDFFYDDNVSVESVRDMLIKSFSEIFKVKITGEKKYV